MTTTTVPRDDLRGALRRVQEALTQAAGADARLAKADIDKALAALAPTERAAVDAFVVELESKRKKGRAITVRDVERAVRSAERRLAPRTVDGWEAPADVDAADVAAARRYGEAMVRLAQRMNGVAGAVLPPIDARKLEGLRGRELMDALRAQCLPHLMFSYGEARDVMFSRVDVDGTGNVRDVYRGRTVRAASRAVLAAQGINTEHTHPQSEGVEGTPAKSDLHHLFPTDAEANGKRSSTPFGVVVGAPVWAKDGAKLGNDADGNLVFEPPDAHKGDAARAMFYVAAMYGLPMEAAEERALRAWHGLDPPDSREKARNDAISAHQENRNPFVDEPALMERIDDI